MGERVLRGSRLGAVSYENDRNTDLAPRQSADYDCPKGHRFSVPLAAEAEVPATWECRYCGATATHAGSEAPEPRHVHGASVPRRGCAKPQGEFLSRTGR